MTDNVKKMAYAGQAPWHGKGVYVGEENISSEEMMQKAELDKEVTRHPLTANGIEVPDKVALFYGEDYLNVVGTGFEVIQPRETFKFLDGLVMAGQMKYHTAGSLDGGKRIWVLGQIAEPFEPVKGDPVERYQLVWDSYGLSSWGYAATNVRVVCQNTWTLAVHEAEKKGVVQKVKHTKNAPSRINEIQKALQRSLSEHDAFVSLATRLGERQVSVVESNSFLDALVPSSVDPDNKRPGRATNLRNTLTDLFENGIGQDNQYVRGTAWGAFNALTQYTTWERKAARSGNTQDRRLNSAWWGSSAQLNQSGLRFLTGLAQDQPLDNLQYVRAFTLDA